MKKIMLFILTFIKLSVKFLLSVLSRVKISIISSFSNKHTRQILSIASSVYFLPHDSNLATLPFSLETFCWAWIMFCYEFYSTCSIYLSTIIIYILIFHHFPANHFLQKEKDGQKIKNSKKMFKFTRYSTFIVFFLFFSLIFPLILESMSQKIN